MGIVSMFDIKAIYTDGGCIGPNPSAIGGTWAYCFVNVAGERIHTASGLVSPFDFDGNPITNNLAEFAAMAYALQAAPAGWHGTVYSDNRVVLGRFFEGWKISNLPRWLVDAGRAALANIEAPKCTFILLDGHPTRAQLAAGIGKRGSPVSEHNVWCDKECSRLAQEAQIIKVMQDGARHGRA